MFCVVCSGRWCLDWMNMNYVAITIHHLGPKHFKILKTRPVSESPVLFHSGAVYFSP